MTSTLAGKTAIITGASSGIGEATARLLAKRGCNVVLAARREDRLESLVSELGDKQTLATPTDVTDPSACTALVDRTLDHFGSLDVLVNNAGLGLYAPITEADPEDWRTMFDVKRNLPGTEASTWYPRSRLLDNSRIEAARP